MRAPGLPRCQVAERVQPATLQLSVGRWVECVGGSRKWSCQDPNLPNRMEHRRWHCCLLSAGVGRSGGTDLERCKPQDQSVGVQEGAGVRTAYQQRER